MYFFKVKYNLVFQTNEKVQNNLKKMYELSLQDSQLQFEKKLVKVCEDCTTLMKQQVSGEFSFRSIFFNCQKL